jgi:hypothetical protein
LSDNACFEAPESSGSGRPALALLGQCQIGVQNDVVPSELLEDIRLTTRRLFDLN